jgi:hypothetical protein
MVIAGREDRPLGAFIGFELDTEFLECEECGAAYRLRYTREEEGNLKEYRLSALRCIRYEHPKHTDQIRIA